MAEKKEKTEKKKGRVAAKCPHCGSANVHGISRVVGYYSNINNWNASKTAEFKDRQKGRYWK